MQRRQGAVKRKPHKVAVIEVARTSVTLFLDREKLDFFAVLGLEEVRAPDIDGLRELVAGKLKNWQPEVWEEFIVVRASPDSSGHHVLGLFTSRQVEITFEFYRGERAKKLDGKTVERLHRLDREKRLNMYRHCADYDAEKKRLEAKTTQHWVPDAFIVLPYSDAAWAQLCRAESQLREVREQIFKTVNSKQFLKMLENGSVVGLFPGRKT